MIKVSISFIYRIYIGRDSDFVSSLASVVCAVDVSCGIFFRSLSRTAATEYSNVVFVARNVRHFIGDDFESCEA